MHAPRARNPCRPQQAFATARCSTVWLEPTRPRACAPVPPRALAPLRLRNRPSNRLPSEACRAAQPLQRPLDSFVHTQASQATAGKRGISCSRRCAGLAGAGGSRACLGSGSCGGAGVGAGAEGVGSHVCSSRAQRAERLCCWRAPTRLPAERAPARCGTHPLRKRKSMITRQQFSLYCGTGQRGRRGQQRRAAARPRGPSRPGSRPGSARTHGADSSSKLSHR